MALRPIYQQHHLKTQPSDPHAPVMPKRTVPKGNRVVIIVFAVLLILGVGTGYVLARGNKKTSTVGGVTTTVSSSGKTAVGSNDSTTFNNSAEGVLDKGGIGGEGTHHLVRDGGPSQTAYLISSVVDLDQFVGKKVKVWGQTIAAQKAPWLMDVGKVEIE